MDRETFDRLISSLSAAERFATRLTGDPASAEDILHDAIVKAAGAAARFSRRKQFQDVVVSNRFESLSRSNSRQPDEGPATEEIADRAAVDPALAGEQRELGEIIAGHVSSLPPREREVLVLIAYEQMSPVDVAKMLEMTEQNVRTTLFHARQRMKQKLAKYLQEDFGANRK